MSKLLIIAAPSGAGKTTIVQHLLTCFDNLSFSVSATTRPRRPHETEGKDYYFFSTAQFKSLIEKDAFVEWEEVYDDKFYGTLKSEVERLWKAEKNIIFDIDVQGALNIKKAYPDKSLSVFVKPPSMDILQQRLQQRQTETKETLRQRLDKAREEMQYEDRFDVILLNDNLSDTLAEAEKIVRSFLYDQKAGEGKKA